jgi:hypothetical protein
MPANSSKSTTIETKKDPAHGAIEEIFVTFEGQGRRPGNLAAWTRRLTCHQATDLAISTKLIKYKRTLKLVFAFFHDTRALPPLPPFGTQINPEKFVQLDPQTIHGPKTKLLAAGDTDGQLLELNPAVQISQKSFVGALLEFPIRRWATFREFHSFFICKIEMKFHASSGNQKVLESYFERSLQDSLRIA